MDRFMSRLARVDDDLVLLLDHGMAYQRDHGQLVAYDERYFDKCAGYEGQAIARAINAGRVALVDRHYGSGVVLDVGVGSGEFIKTRANTLGHDVNPAARAWLESQGKWVAVPDYWPAYTFWDVLEHVPTPERYFAGMRPGAWLFTSLPIFTDLTRIRESRHYRPGEHLYYWTHEGFVRWMHWHGFALHEHATFETDAGRDSIHSYAFRKAPCA